MLTVAGYDIVAERGGNNNVFYFGMRDFDLPEIKLMIDAISSSKHIGVEQSHELIKAAEKYFDQKYFDFKSKVCTHQNIERVKAEIPFMCMISNILKSSLNLKMKYE